MSTYIINENGERFTFEDGMISDLDATTSTDVDQNVMPMSGPGNNLGIDSNGVTKVITLSGNLYDTASTVSSTQDIRDKDVMKFWLEALQNGNQSAKTFYSDKEKYSVYGAGTMTTTDSVSGALITLQAVFTVTKVYVTQIKFQPEEATPELIPFILTLWVVGR